MRERTRCEIYSRCCGYIRPTSCWNEGKVEEFKDRVTFKVNKTSNEVKDGD